MSLSLNALYRSVDRLESRLTEDEQRFEAAFTTESKSTARFYSFHRIYNMRTYLHTYIPTHTHAPK